jgi:hypothetical protein
MIRAIDHLVILVEDLAAASADYAALGFTVTPGGEHADGATHNALVVFADDSYLELIAFKRQAPQHRWWHHTAAGPGLIDYALLPEDIDEDVAAARARGLSFGEPAPGGRRRPDGQHVAWKTAQPTTPDLPFLCWDVTPRSLRVPTGTARQHPNGVVGVSEVIVSVRDLEASAGHYAALLDAQAAPNPEPGRVFDLGTAAIRLLVSAAERGGEGPRALKLRVGTGAGGSLDAARTHGVPIELVGA